MTQKEQYSLIRIVVWFWVILTPFAQNYTTSQKSASAYNDIVITEIMYDPAGGPEWIEIFNASGTPIDLNGYKIYDTDKNDTVSSSSYILQPDSFLVLSDDASMVNNYSYNFSVIELTLPSLNNTGDILILRDSFGGTIDSVNYDDNWGGDDGISLERISYDGSSNDPANWSSSVHPEKATPGKINSVTPVDYDISVERLCTIEPFPKINENYTVVTEIKNNGLNAAENFYVKLLEDNSLADSFFVTSLNTSQTLQLQFVTSKTSTGNYEYSAIVDYSSDLREYNDSSGFTAQVVRPPCGFRDIVINEIMHSPADGEPEWVEIYNNSPDTVNIKEFSICDESFSATIISTNYLLLPNQFIVISENATITNYYSHSFNYFAVNLPGLSNSSDHLFLKDLYGDVVDELSYDSDWGGTGGKSLERIHYDVDSQNPQNWDTCYDNEGGTPGLRNSVAPKDYDLAITSIGTSKQTIYENDELKINCIIENVGLNTVKRISVSLFDRLLHFQIGEVEFDSLAVGRSVIATFDLDSMKIGGYEYSGEIQAYGDQNNRNDNAELKFEVLPKKYNAHDVVVNEIMYNPEDDEPEWVELINLSDNVVNLYGWSFGDEYRSVKLPDTSYYLQPEEYLVISEKENLRSHYSTIPSDILKLSLPSFNNTYDQVVVKDYHQTTIDIVQYNKTWGGTNGTSLEKIISSGASNDSTNWGSAVCIEKATPGKKNSITEKNYDIELAELRYDKEYHVLGTNDSLRVLLKNNGLVVVQNISINAYFTTDNATPNELFYNATLSEVSVGELKEIFIPLEGLKVGDNNILVELVCEDEYPEDNSKTISIHAVDIKINPGDIVINELMYNPGSDSEEWLELFNRSEKDIDLNGLLVADKSKSSVISDKELILRSKDYIVLSSSDEILDKYSSPFNIRVCDLPSLNNNGDEITICDTLNRIIDYVDYNAIWGGETGKSLERVSSDISANDSTNWKTSEWWEGATPGRNNSVCEHIVDLTLLKIRWLPEKPVLGESVDVVFTVCNSGFSATSFSITVEKSNSFYNTFSGFDIAGYDTTEFSIEDFVPQLNRAEEFIVTTQCDDDYNPQDNSIQITVYPGLSDHLVINEIMPYPDTGEPEWFELFNRSDQRIFLENISISDVLTHPEETFLNSEEYVDPGEFVVIAKDSSLSKYYDNEFRAISCEFANLNNYEDGIVLKDYYGTTIDSVYYNREVEIDRGKSLEKVSPFVKGFDVHNWRTSSNAEGATPGYDNSVLQYNSDLGIVSVNYYPEVLFNGDEIGLDVKTRNYGIERSTESVLNIYRILETEREIIVSTPIPPIERDSLIKLSLEGIISIEDSLNLFLNINGIADENPANDTYNLSVTASQNKYSLIVTEFMCYPDDDGCEWIEIFNNSDHPINLKDWSLSDVNPGTEKTLITDDDFFLSQGEYLVCCSDKDIAGEFCNQEITTLYCNFSSLGNSEDGIVLRDFRDVVIDSLYYTDDMKITKGFSLERINYCVASCEKRNWCCSIEKGGSTPGKNNSAGRIEEFSCGDLLITEIMYDPDEGNSEFIEFYNNMDREIELAGLQLICNGDDLPLTRISHDLPAGEYLVLSSDSLIYNNYPWLSEYSHVVVCDYSSFNLSNSGGTISLSDHAGTLVDSVSYSADKHNPNLFGYDNISLERISLLDNQVSGPRWSSSISEYGATPGRKNSIQTDIITETNKVIISPNPFSPDNDGYEDFTSISYSFDSPVSRIRLRVFDRQGRLVRTIHEDHLINSNGSIIFDGLDEDKQPLRMGIYILLLEVYNAEKGFTNTIKDVVVVARKL